MRTLGEADVAGADDKHFGRPQDIAWLPDGSLLVADGLGNSRVAKFDKNGVFVTSWGTRGNGPGQFSGPHGIATDRSGRVYVADRTNHRIQIFDANGTFIDQWPGLRQANDIVISADQHVWVADGTNAKVLEYDQQRETALFLGHVRHVPRRVLGAAPDVDRLGRQSVRRRQLWRTRAEIHAARRRRSLETDSDALAGSIVVLPLDVQAAGPVRVPCACRQAPAVRA